MNLASLCVASYNCNGLANDTKRIEIFTWLARKKELDIIYLQECHSTQDVEEKWRREWEGFIYFNHGTRNQKGVIILFREHLEICVHKIERDMDGRIIILDVEIKSRRFCLVNVYAPNNNEPIFFDTVYNMIRNYDIPIIQAGDYNIALQPSKDRAGESRDCHGQKRHALTSMMSAMDLFDVWRLKNPDLIRYTWRRNASASRIDFFLISFSLIAKAIQVTIAERFRSDHHLIILKLNFVDIDRGKGYWKFNQSLLEDSNFIIKTKQFISDFFLFNTDSANPHIVWDAFKCAFRGHAIKFSSWKYKQTCNRERILLNEVHNIKNRLDTNKSDCIEQDLQKLDEKEKELERFYQNKIKGIIYRTKANWMEQGEKCNKYFLQLQNRNYPRKNISKILKDDGTNIISTNGILETLMEYYNGIFNEKEPHLSYLSLSEHMEMYPHPELTNVQQKLCEGLVTEKELYDAICSFQNGKTPGLDGIPVEVYKTFFTEIKDSLLACYNYSFEIGCQSNSQKEGLISLLLKHDVEGQDKDPVKLKNWRPLTLLCCDTRILAKCLALRLKKVIQDLIHPDQTGFLKGRFIVDNIRRLLEIMDYYDKENLPGLIFIADFEKAFDTINWNFIYQCLNIYNFGESFIKWIHVLYQNPCSKIINNGHISDKIVLSKGVRQGCPLSAYLFILSIEMLAIRIRNNANIKGLEVNGLESKSSFYADDASFYINPDALSLDSLITELDSFALLSGLKPNYDKCSILRIGSLKRSNQFSFIVPIQCSEGPVNLLGIHIPVDKELLVKINFEIKLQKMNKILQAWRGKYLSIFGKVTVINSLILSQFTYLLQALPSPDTLFMKTYEKVIFNFIWNGKTDKIKRTYVYNTRENGGLGLKSLAILDMALKGAWIQRLYNNQHWFSSKLFIAQCGAPSIAKLYPFFQLDQESKVTLNNLFPDLSLFFRNCLSMWFCFQFSTPDNILEIKQQILWLNSNICIDKKPVYWQSFLDNNVLFVNDLLNDKGDFLSYESFTSIYGNFCSKLRYLQLISAISPAWKTILIDSNTYLGVCRPAIKNYKWLGHRKVNFDMYTFFVSFKNTAISPYYFHDYWKSIFDTPLPWLNIFKNLYKSSCSTYLWAFQVKIFYKILPTKKMLKIWRITEDKNCRYCGEEEEDILHLFWYCPDVARFWHNVAAWLYEQGLILLMSPIYIIWGVYEEENMLLNTIVLLGKYFIFKREKHIKLELFVMFLKHYYLLTKNMIKDKSRPQSDSWQKLVLIKKWDKEQ